jgi:hypothetical protein
MNPDPQPADIEVRRVRLEMRDLRVPKVRKPPRGEKPYDTYSVLVPHYQFKAATSTGQDWIEDELGLRCKAQNNCWEMDIEGDRQRCDLIARLERDGLKVTELWRQKPTTPHL